MGAGPRFSGRSMLRPYGIFLRQDTPGPSSRASVVLPTRRARAIRRRRATVAAF
jgi:hypothetical protein